MQKVCKTCQIVFEARRKDKVFCSRLCFRRFPENAKKYSDRTNAHIKTHSKEPRRRWQKLTFKCRHENRELDLTQEKCEELWKDGCFYCNKTLQDETGCSLDRIDNNVGYTITNVVPCCGNCNKMRNNILSHEEMKIAMTAVLNYRRSHA
jgi:hypothetical protein